MIAADLGGTNLRAAIIDDDGRVLDHVKHPTPRTKTADGIAQAIIEASQTLAGRNERYNGRVRALSVVVPGTVNVEEGVVTQAPNLPCLDGFRLAAALTDALTWPTVLENDANAAAVGEMWRGAARDRQTIVCLTLGTGVGGGLILDGKLWRGVDGAAGEIGHIVVEPVGAPCGCGGRGCLEVYSSATAIVRMAREILPHYPSSPLHTADNLTAEAVYRRGLEGDELAREVFRRMGFYLGVGCASLVNLLNPEMIVIGGGVVGGWDLFSDHMREQMMARAFAIPARRVEVVRAQCGDSAGLLGAARLAFASLV